MDTSLVLTSTGKKGTKKSHSEYPMIYWEKETGQMYAMHKLCCATLKKNGNPCSNDGHIYDKETCLTYCYLHWRSILLSKQQS